MAKAQGMGGMLRNRPSERQVLEEGSTNIIVSGIDRMNGVVKQGIIMVGEGVY